MKNIILLICILLSFSVNAQTTDLKLASDVWPPFTNIEEEKAFATDLVYEALARVGIKSESEILEFSDVITGIDAGDYDGSAALWHSPDRAKKYIFSNAYLHNQLVLVGSKGSDVSAITFDDFNGVRIGIVNNYAYGMDINSDKVTLLEGNSDQQNLERLLSGEIDYMLVDALLIQYLLKYQVNDVTAYLEISQAPMMTKPLYFVLRKDVADADVIMVKFNTEIQTMIADGTYNKILELNWLRADIDGDGQMELILDGNAAGTTPPEYAYGVNTDASLVAKPGGEKYYVDGNMYNGWEDIPQSYKTEIIMSNQDMRDTGIKLNFKK